MRVVHLASSYATTYNPVRAVFFRDQAMAVRRRGHAVAVVAPTHVSLEVLAARRLDLGYHRWDDEGVPTFRWQYPADPRSSLSYLLPKNLTGWLMLDACARELGRPDIIHVQTYLAGDIALRARREWGVPFVVTEHWTTFLDGSLRPWQERLAARVFKGASAVLAVGRRLADALESRYGVPAQVVPNVVDTDFFSPGPPPEPPPAGGAPFLFVNASSYFEPRKNQIGLLDAFARAFPGDHGVRLAMAGGGDPSSARRRAEELGLSSRVEILPRLGREGVRNLMRRADRYVLPSTLETFGVVLAEAMACGVPAVATRSGGPESIVDSPSLGILCDLSTDALADALRASRAASYDRAAIRAAAVSRYSRPAVGAAIEAVYARVLAGPRRLRPPGPGAG